MGIVSAVVLLAAVLALFLFRALAGREPPHVVLVQGSAKWLGAELELSGPPLPQPYVVPVSTSDRYSVPFFVHAGHYTLRVRVEGRDVFERSFEVGNIPETAVVLPPDGPSTQPATLPAG